MVDGAGIYQFITINVTYLKMAVNEIDGNQSKMISGMIWSLLLKI